MSSSKKQLPPEKVLLWDLEMPSLFSLLADYQISYRVITPEELRETVGYLAGFPGFMKSQEAAPAAVGTLLPTLIMAGFTSARMNLLLSALRGAKLQIPLKATVTVTNQFWTVEKLIGELSKERAAILARGKTHKKR